VSIGAMGWSVLKIKRVYAVPVAIATFWDATKETYASTVHVNPTLAMEFLA